MFKKFKIALPLAAFLAIAGFAYAQTSRNAPLAYCYDSSLGSAVGLTSFTCATFTGTGSGTKLTASSVTGLLQPGMTISGTGVPSGTTIVSQTSGPAGGAGVYVTSNPTTSNSASLTEGGVPLAANYAVICAYTQGIVWRDDGVAPTTTAGTGGNGLASGACVSYNGDFAALQIIQQQSSAVAGVEFYKGS